MSYESNSGIIFPVCLETIMLFVFLFQSGCLKIWVEKFGSQFYDLCHEKICFMSCRVCRGLGQHEYLHILILNNLSIPVQVQSRVQKYFIKLAKAGLPIPGRRPNMNAYGTKKVSQISYN